MKGAKSNAVMAAVARHKAIVDAATMAELIACGRLFHAVINMAIELPDDEMDVLAPFDEYLTEIIARREPVTPQEFAAKAEYLFGRLAGEDVATATADSVSAILAADAARFRGAVVSPLEARS